MTRRRWIADSWTEQSATLNGAHAEHLARVLRTQVGMEFDLVVGDRVVRATASDVSETSVSFVLGDEIEASPALPVTLLLSIFKFDRLEWAIEKATELGVARIVPIIAQRTEKHLGLAARARVERWRRIAREAAQQSRRSEMVLIEDVVGVKAAVDEEPAAVRLLLSEHERALGLREAVDESMAELVQDATTAAEQRFFVAIGPEGGWTQQEQALFAAAGWKPVSLGPRILRAETAAIAAIAVIAASLD